MAKYLIKKTPEQFMEGFCPEHWFRDSGICAYCKMKRIGSGVDAESTITSQQNGPTGWQDNRGQGTIA
jgi:hypothetical protein